MLTLIRHGQAGSRQQYDDLSDIGREQARLLGGWFSSRGISFDAIVTGNLERQKLTASAMIAAMPGVSIQVSVDPRWTEFDLDRVYAGIAPQLACEDEHFRAQYDELQAEIADPASPAHRTWRECDISVVRAWIEGRFAFEGESFLDFGERVRQGLYAPPPNLDIAVVTSATPIALCIAAALDLAPRRVMQLAGALRNASFTGMSPQRGDPRLISFNSVPHLPNGRLLTLR